MGFCIYFKIFFPFLPDLFFILFIYLFDIFYQAFCCIELFTSYTPTPSDCITCVTSPLLITSLSACNLSITKCLMYFDFTVFLWFQHWFPPSPLISWLRVSCSAFFVCVCVCVSMLTLNRWLSFNSVCDMAALVWEEALA